MLELNLIFVHENVFIRFPKLLESKKAIPPNWAAQSDENEVLSVNTVHLNPRSHMTYMWLE